MKAKYFYGYNILAAGFVVQAVSVGSMFTYGVFFKVFQTEFGWSRANIAGAWAMSFLIMGAIGILAGRLNDKIGPKVLIVVPGIALGLCFLLMSRLRALWQLYLFYMGLASIGLSAHDIITLSVVARWFVRRRGMMSGILKVGTGAGQVAGPLIATALIAGYGWRKAYVIIGIVVIVILVSVAQAFRREPEEMGLLPDGVRDAPGVVVAGATEVDVPLRSAVLTRQFWILCIAWFATFFCLLTIIGHIVPHAIDLGLNPPTAAGVLSTIGGVSMLGRFVLGATNDRLGGKRSLIICFVVLICSLVSLQTAMGVWGLFVFAAIYGFAHGGFFTVLSPTIAELFGIGSHGLLFGIILFFGTIGASIGPVIAGRAFDVTGSYRIVFLLLIAMAIFGFLLIALLRPLKESARGGLGK